MSKSKTTEQLIAESRVILNNLELMTSKTFTWTGDPRYPNQEAKRLQTIAHTLQQRTLPSAFIRAA